MMLNLFAWPGIVPATGWVRLAAVCAAFFSAALAAQEPQSELEARPVFPGEISAGIKTLTFPPVLVQSNDGRWLSFLTSKGEGLRDLQTGRTYNPPGWNIAWGNGGWAPVGGSLSMNRRREGKNSLFIWDGNPQSLENLTRKRIEEGVGRELFVFPRKLYPQLPSVWSPDGKTIFLWVNQHLPWLKSHPDDDNPPTSSVNVNLRMTAPYLRVTKRPRFEKEYPEAYAENTRSLILAVDLATGKFGVVGRGNDVVGIFVSPNGRKLAVSQDKRGLNSVDVYILDIPEVSQTRSIDLEAMEDRKAGWSDYSGKRLAPVMKDLSPTAQALMWSPDSARIAFITREKQDKTNNLFVYSVADGLQSNLTQAVALKPSTKSLGFLKEDRNGFSNPIWMDDINLVSEGGGEIWAISVNPKNAPRVLTANLPYEARDILASRISRKAVVDDKGRITVLAKERVSRRDSFWKVDPHNGEVSKAGDADAWINLMLHDVRNDGALYLAQHEQSSTNAYEIRLDGSKPAFITRYKLELAQRIFPETRVLEYRTPEGRKGFGLLYLPPGASATNKVPLIVNVPEREEVSVLDERMVFGASFFSDYTYARLKEGVAVFRPDVPLSWMGEYERPMKQAVDGIMAATDAALATGVIDDQKLGIIGIDYGGFMVQAVLTRTQRFKAAVAISGVANWYGNYLAPGYEAIYHEHLNARLEKPIWEDPARYVENSPITYYDRIRTPLLLISGEHEWSLTRNDESFEAMRRLDRTAIYARHTRTSSIESLNRSQGWFREHLLGGPKVTQVADQGSFFLEGSLEGTSE